MGEHLALLILYAPLSGKLVPITEVPDAVFAQKLVGDGIAIVQESDLLCAPCDGTVTQIHSSLHAITITSSEGVQILLHVGVDTVQLNGRNFLPEVSTGSLVKTGDALISFDVSYLKAVAPSPLCMMVVVNNDMAVALEAGSGEVLAGKSPVLAVSFESKGPSWVLPAGGEIEESPLICIRNPSGLHARPAAVLADSAKRYHAQIYLLKGGQEANAKSITSLLALDVQIHDNVMVRAAGPDAREAIKKIMPLVQQELGARFASERAEIEGEAVERNHVYTTDVNAKKEAADSYYGLPASPGRAVGTVLCLTREIHEDDEIRPGRNEKARLTAALERAGADLRELARRIETASDATGAAIFTAHLEVLQDPEILAKAQAGIQAGESAAHAWRGAFIPVAENLAKLENSLLANRAVDVRDVGHRVLALLGGEKRRNLTLPENVIIVCDEMTPSEIAEFDRDRISGLCAARGSASSHTFILARSLGIPAIAGIDERALGIAKGTVALIDGDAGVLRIHPVEREITSL